MKRTREKQLYPDAEAMVDATQASSAMCLPYYWFANAQVRNAKRIPHYLLGGLVRYRPSEVMEWVRRTSTAPTHGAQPRHSEHFGGTDHA